MAGKRRVIRRRWERRISWTERQQSDGKAVYFTRESLGPHEYVVSVYKAREKLGQSASASQTLMSDSSYQSCYQPRCDDLGHDPPMIMVPRFKDCTYIHR